MRESDHDLLRWARIDARRLSLDVSREHLLRWYRQMLLARLVDDRLADLRAGGYASGGASCRGHEAAQIGCIAALSIGTDFILPYYRDLAAMLALGMPPRAIFLNQLSRGSDPISNGRMRPAQWNSRALNVISASGLVGTQTLHAAGIAFAARIRGEAAVALTFFGEGATSQGDFHEALNFAGLHHLPVIFVCENNGIALSTPQGTQMPVQHVADRAAAYGMPGVIVDGTDLLAVIATARDAFANARAGKGPTLIEVVVPRLATDAPDPRDPVLALRGYLLSRQDLTDAQDERLRADLGIMIDAALQEAVNAPSPDPATVAEHLFSDSGASSRKEA
ncbi:MAG: thiamine pyrophosphate-dependent dehydrogenase E1 component subunit alpha [Ktedonobacterales bacterium]|nr:thiamine pyrophosphate-dependent dehydrogenase E1 component subunit alpha [Ktedonobacterales bacterium]